MSKTVERITIIVCTYNRADILQDCLKSLVNQTASEESYDILVVDNNSTDNTKEIVENFQQSYNNLRYYLERKQGLSHARNAGYKNTMAKWVGYIDDDAKAHEDFIVKALQTINDNDFDCFGGIFYPWYKWPKPQWLDSNFGKFELGLDKTSVLKEGYNTGCNIFFRTEILQRYKGFPTSLGMTGTQVAYGEETYIQDLIRKDNLIIGFSPEVKIDHLVLKHKLKLKWHLNFAYAMGRDNTIMWSQNASSMSWHYFGIKLFKLSIYNLKYIGNLFTKNYYIQNFVIDYLSPILNWIGIYKALKVKKNVRN